MIILYWQLWYHIFGATAAPKDLFNNSEIDMCLGPERFGYPSGQRRIRSKYSILATCPDKRNNAVRPCHYNFQHRRHLSGQDLRLSLRFAAPTFHSENLPLVRDALRLAPTEPHEIHSQL